MIVFTSEGNPATLKILIAAEFAKQQVEVKVVRRDDSALPEPKHFPTLVEGDCALYSSNSAAFSIFPPSDVEECAVEEWLEWEASVLALNLFQFYNSCTVDTRAALEHCLDHLNDILDKRQGVNVQDVVIWASLYPLYKDEKNDILSQFSNVKLWLDELFNCKQVQTVLAAFPVPAGHAAYKILQDGIMQCVQNVSAKPHSLCTADESAVSADELVKAKDSWLNGGPRYPRAKEDKNPVLPMAGERNILITSSLPYVNNVPHLGNIIGCVLSADVFARFCRLCNYNTLYICGTDEYGTATETKALEENLTPQQICDKYFEIHNGIYRWFNIGFDSFGRTTTSEQTEIVQRAFLELNKNGFMQVQSIEQLYCEKCDRYLADRFVEGGCPHPGCGKDDARGDQCDGCGKLVNATELKNPKCKVCNSSPVLRNTKEFFIDLPKLEPLLRHWIDKSAPGWSNNARIIAKSWLKEGLKPRCITRALKWGVPVPTEGFQNKVFYVWFDAPLGYVSITARYTKQYEKWWKPEKGMDVRLYQFMAKDNVPFHAVMFPAVLLGLNQGHTMVSHIFSTEYLNYEDGKFSKSRGIGVFGNDAQRTGIPSDVWRFYLLYVRPETQDSSFSWIDLATKNNSELLNNLGNFINRTLTFADKFFDGIIPMVTLTEQDCTVLALCNRELKGYMAALEKAKLRDGIRYILNISRHGNQYIQSTQPWLLVKGATASDRDRAGTVIGLCCNIVYLLSTLLFPYMPETSRTIRKQMNVTADIVLDPKSPEVICLIRSGHKIGKPLPLFNKIEPSRVEELKKLFSGRQQDDNSQVCNGSTVKTASATCLNGTLENAATVAQLEELVNKQASIVRELKSKGTAKTEWQPQVNVLLDLKRQLATAVGGETLLSPTLKKK